MTADAQRADLAERLLFGAALVDAGWLTEFSAALNRWKDWLSCCESTVAARYGADPSSRDGYSRIGWAMGQLGHSGVAIAAFERDWQLDRMRRWQFVRYVEALIAAGRIDDASERVVDYYARHPEARDGWAAIGTHWQRQNQFERAREMFRRDLAAGRLSSVLSVALAGIEARLGSWAAAEEVVVQAYATDPNLKDGFSRVAEVRAQSGQACEALRLFRRDAQLDRLTWSGSWRFASRLVECVANDPEGLKLLGEAAGHVEFAYRAAPDFRGGFGKLAQILWRDGFLNEAIEFFQRDEQLARQTPETSLVFAECQLKLGDEREAHRRAAQAIEQTPGLSSEWKARFASVRESPVPMLDQLVADVLRDCRHPRAAWASYMRSNAGRIARDFRNLKPHIRPQDRIVDIGCVPPLLLALLHQNGFRSLSAVDPFLAALEPFLMRAGIRSFDAGITNLPVAQLRASADLVCLCEVVEHVAVNLVEVFSAIREMLCEGGRLYLTTPNLRSISGLYALLARRSGLASKPFETVRAQFDRPGAGWGYYGHLREYTAREIVLLVESCGFRHEVSFIDPVSVVRMPSPKWVHWLERLLPEWRLFGAHLFVRK